MKNNIKTNTKDKNCNKLIIKTIFFISLVLIAFFSFFITNSIKHKKQIKQNYKSEFSRLMLKEDDYIFIKSGELELVNIDSYIRLYEDDLLFQNYMEMQRNCLINEINLKKQKSVNQKKEDKVEYKKIDYIKTYKQYCIGWNSYDQYLDFCHKYSLIP